MMWKKANQGTGLKGVQLRLVNSATGPSNALADALWKTATTTNQVCIALHDPDPFYNLLYILYPCKISNRQLLYIQELTLLIDCTIPWLIVFYQISRSSCCGMTPASAGNRVWPTAGSFTTALKLAV